ncbi:MAG: undecaprenyl/decaprenyl-phosphate alpha-N-acetylglucosaminyl 1-phosphate transferase [Bacteroidia bacterium]|nr:undecaprenyl/decaprenyl-phosphate alpha-N-acetylglucosaminyl 1-phosphate transferase [Bacteroidia bacterium]
MAAIATAFVGFLSAWVWNEIFLRFARRLGALSQGIPNQRRWDSRKKPIIGGIAFFIVCLGIAAWKPMEVQVSRALLAGGVVAFLTGLADDAYVSVPYAKLLGQLSAGSIAIILGSPLLSVSPVTVISVIFTIFWYAAVMNAFNMMDNMDGIAGSLSLVLLLNTFWLLPHTPHYLLYSGLIGAIGAFLMRNFHPSYLYMGDNGSQFLGFILAYWGAEAWNAPFLSSWDTWTKLLLIVSLFALLAGDAFWVIVMRIRAKRSPFTGGTDHLTHRLGQLGLPARSIAIGLALTQLLLSVGTMVITLYLPVKSWLLLGTLALVGVGIGLIHLLSLKQGPTPIQLFPKVGHSFLKH